MFSASKSGKQLLLAARALKMRRRVALFFVTALVWSSVCLAHGQFTGEVVGVSDGDTISVMQNGRAVRVRLDGIDCPEQAQDFGQRAKRFTSSLVFGKKVVVDVRDVDRYGRLVARVYTDGEDVSLALLRAGFAWHYKQYSSDRMLADAENEARASRIGLWSQGTPVAPWQFRHPAATATPRGPVAASVDAPFHGNLRSRVFHRPGCANYGCKNCTREFKAREDAIAAGFRPAGDCLN